MDDRYIDTILEENRAKRKVRREKKESEGIRFLILCMWIATLLLPII
jgi:hypothetical protein